MIGALLLAALRRDHRVHRQQHAAQPGDQPGARRLPAIRQPAAHDQPRSSSPPASRSSRSAPSGSSPAASSRPCCRWRCGRTPCMAPASRRRCSPRWSGRAPRPRRHLVDRRGMAMTCCGRSPPWRARSPPIRWDPDDLPGVGSVGDRADARAAREPAPGRGRAALMSTAPAARSSEGRRHDHDWSLRRIACGGAALRAVQDRAVRAGQDACDRLTPARAAGRSPPRGSR